MMTYRQRKQRHVRKALYLSFSRQMSEAGWAAVASAENETDMVAAMVRSARRIAQAMRNVLIKTAR